MCPLWFALASLTSFPAACPLADAQSCFSSAHRAQGAGDGDFVIDFQQWDAPVGPRLHGVVDPGLTPVAGQYFAELGVTGGLYRANVRMDVLQERARQAAEAIYQGHMLGMKVLLTCVGTPRNNSTGDPEGEDWYTLPGYARTPPADIQLWADDLQAMLVLMKSNWGQVPDYVEIWNEPERIEWWTGTKEEFLELYRVAATAVKAAYPQIRVGGAGFASAGSSDQPDAPSPEDLIADCALDGTPLDFVSWHHYNNGLYMSYRNTLQCFRDAVAGSGLPAMPQFIVSEWNVHPSGNAGSPTALELDTAPAAARAASFLVSSIEQGLDANCFFMTEDVQDGDLFAVQDLTGPSTGSFTHHGVKKPVYRLYEFLYPMADYRRVKITPPQNEWSVSAIGAELPDGNLRLIVANDPVDGMWVWLNGVRENGGVPGTLSAAVSRLHRLHLPLTEWNLIHLCNLSQQDAQTVLEVWPRAVQAQYISRHPRTVRFQLQNGMLRPVQAWRFDRTHNAPVLHRASLMPDLQRIELDAENAGTAAATTYLESQGVDVPDAWTSITDWPSSAENLAQEVGTTLDVAAQGWKILHDTLEDERLAERVALNDRPETWLVSETPESAGLVRDRTYIDITLPPSAVLIVDCAWKTAGAETGTNR